MAAIDLSDKIPGCVGYIPPRTPAKSRRGTQNASPRRPSLSFDKISSVTAGAEQKSAAPPAAAAAGGEGQTKEEEFPCIPEYRDGKWYDAATGGPLPKEKIPVDPVNVDGVWRDRITGQRLKPSQMVSSVRSRMTPRASQARSETKRDSGETKSAPAAAMAPASSADGSMSFGVETHSQAAVSSAPPTGAAKEGSGGAAWEEEADEALDADDLDPDELSDLLHSATPTAAAAQPSENSDGTLNFGIATEASTALSSGATASSPARASPRQAPPR